MKILIAGVGKVGRELTRKLGAEGHDLTVIDTDKVFPIIETEDYYADGKFVPGKY